MQILQSKAYFGKHLSRSPARGFRQLSAKAGRINMHSNVSFEVLYKNEEYFKHHAISKGGVLRQDLSVVFDKRNNVQFVNGSPQRDPELYKIWQARLETNPSFFNGTKFRLAKVHCEEGKVTLELGLCDYRSFICTNSATTKQVNRLKQLGTELLGDERGFLADTVGVSCILTTCDDYLVMMRRSDRTGELPGYWDTPGGHPEPSAMGLSFSFDDIGTIDKAIESFESKSTDLNRSVCNELYNSVIDEVTAEINVPKTKLLDPALIGICRYSHAHGKPGMSFTIKTTLTGDQVAEQYVAGGEEADESVCLLLIPAYVLQKRSGECIQVMPGTGERTNITFEKVAEKLTPSVCFAL